MDTATKTSKTWPASVKIDQEVFRSKTNTGAAATTVPSHMDHFLKCVTKIATEHS